MIERIVSIAILIFAFLIIPLSFIFDLDFKLILSWIFFILISGVIVWGVLKYKKIRNAI